MGCCRHGIAVRLPCCIPFFFLRSSAVKKSENQIAEYGIEYNEDIGIRIRRKTMKTAIVTDTNSGMSASEGNERGIFILPMPVIIEGSTYREGVDLTAAELFSAMHEGKNVSTSQPDPMSLKDMWDRVFSEGYDEIVHIPMSSGLSGSCGMAQMMANDYDGKVQVADNHRISIPMYESVLDAKAMADQGTPAAEIRAFLEEHAAESTIYLIVDTMKYLEKGGRITHGAAVMGSLLKIKPVLTIQGEKVDAVAKTRGMVSARKKMFEFLKKDFDERFASFPAEKVMIGCATTLTDEGEIEMFCNQLKEMFPDHPFECHRLPCSVACHVGPGTVGVGLAVMRR